VPCRWTQWKRFAASEWEGQNPLKALLAEWDRTRPKRRPRYVGGDEIHHGKAQKFYTMLSDLVHGEVIGLAPDRTEANLASRR
jgi:hypothetical protein